MSRLVLPRAALRAACVVTLIAGCGSAPTASSPGTSSPGAPSLTSSGPSAVAPAPSQTPLESAVAAPARMWGDWIAEVPAIPAIEMPAGMIQLSVDWEDGKEVWLQTTPDYRQLLHSTPLPASEGELRLATVPGTMSCSRFAEGRYRWDRSAEGLFLTLTLIEDACPARATVFARTWVRSHGAVNDGGPGVNYGVKPYIQMTLPTSAGQRWAMRGGEAAPELTTYRGSPSRAFVVIQNPGGYDGQGGPQGICKPQAIAIEPTIEAFVAYVEGLPIQKVTSSTTKVGGRPAVRLDVQAPGTTCQRDGLPAFRPQNPADEASWWLAPSERLPIYIVQMDRDTTYLLWYQGPAVEEEAVIGSISFIDRLPTAS